MAKLESVLFTPHQSLIVNGEIKWLKLSNGKHVADLPLLFWSDGAPWREANLWLMLLATSRDVSLKTVLSNASSLLTYANWLEETGTDWWDFPPRKDKRCLVRYRGALIDARNRGDKAPSTVSQRMRVAVRFYRWLEENHLITHEWPLWRERSLGVQITDSFGFTRTLSVGSTDLSIHNSPPPGERLEDGLLPVSVVDRNLILDIAYECASQEIALILKLGFFTGMRLQTITDLKIQSLMYAVPDPATSELYRIAVGPGASPPIATKYGITGHIYIPRCLLDELINYAHSTRRLLREVKAKTENKDLLFLTSFGNPYAQRGTDKSVAVNVEMHSLRKIAARRGVVALRDFKFHQSRCTFATELAKIAIKAGGAIYAIGLVREALLHRNESSSLAYIKFVEKLPIKEQAANEFTRAFLGLAPHQTQLVRP